MLFGFHYHCLNTHCPCVIWAHGSGLVKCPQCGNADAVFYEAVPPGSTIEVLELRPEHVKIRTAGYGHIAEKHPFFPEVQEVRTGETVTLKPGVWYRILPAEDSK
jgi:hypothetical protein